MINKPSIRVTNQQESDLEDKLFWENKTALERLAAVEALRLESGKFLYEYPKRLQRILTLVRKA